MNVSLLFQKDAIMKKCILFFILLFVTLLPVLNAKPTIGINLAGIADWSTELPFVDVFLNTRAWISQREGDSWGKGPKLDVDERGWVRFLQKGCFAEVPLCTIDGGHYPSGIYTVTYEGEGKLEFGNAKVVQDTVGKIQIEVDSAHGAFWLRIKKTNPDNYLRNIHVYLPGFAEPRQRSQCGAWNPKFLERWRGMKVVRFMDLQQTNNSRLQTWSQRPIISDSVYSRAGVPLELLCDLANRLEADAWFCVPHAADDDFVRKMAKCLKQNLNQKSKIYLEYSNEVWNGQFEQNRFAAEKGIALKFAQQPWEAAWKYTAYRSVQIFAIFEKEFDGVSRLVRVLPSQAANAYVSRQILEFQEAYKQADALAIAPYMSYNIPNETADQVIESGLSGILQYLDSKALPECIRWMQEQKKTADDYNLKLVAYEAGQHCVGLWGANDKEELNQLLYAANRSTKMGELYEKYFDAWKRIGGDSLCCFSSVGKWSKYGSWGLIEYLDEDPNAIPKCQRVLKTAETWNRSK